MELYKKYRPVDFSTVYGQDSQIKVLKSYIENNNLPHAILLTGNSGTGKTTIARILANKLECNERELTEINSADFRGIDTVREIRNNVNYTPVYGKTKVWILDEVHMGTSQFQESMLKLLEEAKPHCYFILCTTNPEKLIRTIKTRCTTINLSDVNDKSLKKIIKKTLNKEEKTLAENIIDVIIDNSIGSPRAALVMLDEVINLPEDEQEDYLNNITSGESEVIDLCRALLSKKSWGDVSKILSNLSMEPEKVRYAVLGYANSVLLRSGDYHAYWIIDCFSDNFYDSKKAGLTRACYEVVKGK